MTRKILVVFLLLLTAVVPVMAQGPQQANLLTKAYKLHSTRMLYNFFDNWSEEVKTNEKEAQNSYVAEAYKVFAAFYQPLQTYPNQNKRFSLYDKRRYFIVQGSLSRIQIAECIPHEPAEIDSFMVNRIRQRFEDDSTQNVWIERHKQEKYMPCYYSYLIGPSFARVPMTTLDSAVSFRPPVHFDRKKVVYLTDGYEELLNSFLGNCYDESEERDTKQSVFSKCTSWMKQQFFNKAALIFYGHWGGYWEYVTFPKANSIILNPEMNRAIVLFRFIYGGGEVYLEKKGGEWTVVDTRFTWIE